MSVRYLLLLGLVMFLSACASSDTGLMSFPKTLSHPDEFAVTPAKSLEEPADVASLPLPTPGGSNRADQTPLTDAVVALGGDPTRAGRGGDGALLRQVTRFGARADIRPLLADEDAAWRARKQGRLLERWANVNRYFRAYAPMSLDKHAELERLRAAGVAVPPTPSLAAVAR